MPEWVVEVDAMVRATRKIKVRAACADDAQSRAYEIAGEDTSDDWEVDTAFVDVFETTVIAVPT